MQHSALTTTWCAAKQGLVTSSEQMQIPPCRCADVGLYQSIPRSCWLSLVIRSLSMRGLKETSSVRRCVPRSILSNTQRLWKLACCYRFWPPQAMANLSKASPPIPPSSSYHFLLKEISTFDGLQQWSCVSQPSWMPSASAARVSLCFTFTPLFKGVTAAVST